jgi:O-antigen/teichoic acid export membrane protein
VKDFLRNITANSILTIWAIIFQFISVPVFLTYWGVAKYGEWIVLNSVTVFFQMSDIGLTTASLNSFVINYQKGNLLVCKKIINNNIVVISGIFLLVFLLLLFLFELNLFEKLLKFEILDSRKVPVYIFLLFLYTYLGTISNSLASIYTAVGKYSRCIMIDNVFKFFEGSVLIYLLITNTSLFCILLGYLLVRVLQLLFKVFDISRYYTIQISIKNLDYLELKNILRPALAFFAIPFSNTFIYQGFTLLVNFYYGASSVVLYSTSRTLVNMIKAVSDIVTRSMWPNISFAFARQNFKLVRLYHSRTVLYSFGIFFIALFCFILFSKPVYLHWTRGTSEFDTLLFFLLLIAMFLNLLQSSSGLILQATNQHSKYVIHYFFYYLVGLFSAFLLTMIIHDLSLIAIGLIIPEFFLIIYAGKSVLVLTKDSLKALQRRLVFDFKFHVNKVK